MRLTLRTLLAYLDDTLDPVQTRQIGQKVAESETARELIDKLRKVARKRGINAPPVRGPEGADADLIAAYLDNDLDSEKVAELEERALHSDMLLAEIAACHQLLTIILSEPAKVPPTARQRMYGLISGPEVDPTRKAPRVASATINVPQPGTSEFEVHPLVSHRDGPQRLVLAGGLFLLFCVSVWGVFQMHRPEKQVVSPATQVAESPAPAEQPPVDKPKEEPKVEPPAVVTKAPDSPPPSTPATVPAEAKPTESKPPMPLPLDPKPAEKKAPDSPPPPPPETPPTSPPATPTVDMEKERKTSTERNQVGRFTAGPLLLMSAYPGAPWRKMMVGDSVTGMAQLMSLPGLSAEVRLADAVSLDLDGSVIDFIAYTHHGPFLESAVTAFAPPPGFDADVRLERGRLFIKATRPDGAKVRLRLHDDFVDLQLPDDKSEVLAEHASVYNGEKIDRSTPTPPVGRAAVCMTQGTATVRFNKGAGLVLHAPPGTPAVMNWNSQSGARPSATKFDAVPPIWAKQPPLPVGPLRERAVELQNLLKNIPKLFADPKKDLTTSFAELPLERSPYGKILAVYCRAALDDVGPVLDALDDSQSPESRLAAIEALIVYLGRDSAAHFETLSKQLRQRGYSDAEVGGIIGILIGPSPEQVSNPKTYADLIENLKEDRMAVREVSLWRLAKLDPEARIGGNLADQAVRKRVVEEWKRRIPDGKLPPKPAGTKGR